MKKLFLIIACATLTTQLFAQAKRPTIMVVPSDAWCIANGYATTYDNQGTEMTVPDYTAALQNNMDLLQVISKLNDLMSDRGFPLQNLESVIKNISQSQAEMSMLQSKQGGEVQTTLYEQVRNRARADIIMQISWDIVTQGPRKSIRYNLQGLDSYTNKQVAGDSGVGEPSFAATVPVLLEEAVYSHMDNFCDRLQAHFDDMFENGREVAISIRVFDTSEYDLESDFDGYELCEIIDNWFADNTVNHRYSVVEQSQNVMQVEQVRIPIYDERERPMDANRFARNLVRFLRAEPYLIPSIKVLNQGLGKVTLVIGDK